jgi:hypothetical protein
MRSNTNRLRPPPGLGLDSQESSADNHPLKIHGRIILVSCRPLVASTLRYTAAQFFLRSKQPASVLVIMAEPSFNDNHMSRVLLTWKKPI